MMIDDLRKKLLAVIDEINAEVCEREELVHCIALALLTRKNLFVLGDTGQAKSYAVNEFCKRIEGAQKFEKLMSKQADEDQLFGRLDLASIIPGNVSREVLMSDDGYHVLLDKLETAREQYRLCPKDTNAAMLSQMAEQISIYRRALAELRGGVPNMITKGKIPDSHIVFLDELFKANEGVLNSLLTVLNERKWTNEGEVIHVPVLSFFSASNEIPNFANPEEKILKPLYDRFDLKVLTRYVQDRGNRLQMLNRKRAVKSGVVTASITLEELLQMQEAVANIPVSPDMDEVMDDILCELRRQGVHVSDRKFFGYHPLARAQAFLSGAEVVERGHLAALTPYFWNKPEEIGIIDNVLERFCKNPILEKLKAVLDDAGECYSQFEAAENKKRALIKLRNEYLRLYDRLCAMMNDVNQEEQAQIAETQARIEELSRRASGTAGNTYIPLNELKELSK